MPRHGLTKRCLTSGAGQQQVQHGRTSCSATTSAGQSGLHAVSREGELVLYSALRRHSQHGWCVAQRGMPRTLAACGPHLRSQSARAAMRSSRRRDTSHRPHAFSVTTRSCSTVATGPRSALSNEGATATTATGGGRHGGDGSSPAACHPANPCRRHLWGARRVAGRRAGEAAAG